MNNKTIFSMAAVFTALICSNAVADVRFTDNNAMVTVDPPAAWPAGFTAEPVTTQATEDILGDNMVIGMDFALDVGDRIVFTVNNGATFANPDLVIEQSQGGAGTGAVDFGVLQGSPVDGDTSITFIMQESASATALADARLFILSGSTLAGQSVLFNLPGTPGVDISITAQVFTSVGVLRDSSTAYPMFIQQISAPPAPVPAMSPSALGLLVITLMFAGFRLRPFSEK